MSRSILDEAVAMKRLPPMLRVAVALLAIAPRKRREEIRNGAVVALLKRDGA